MNTQHLPHSPPLESLELGTPHDPDLIKITEIFLVPSSFLVAALGTADSNPHRAAVSALGLIVSVLWHMCSREAFEALPPPELGLSHARYPLRTRILAKLPYVFIFGWMISLVAHAMMWNRPLGH